MTKKEYKHPLPGALYQITGGPGEKCLSNGNFEGATHLQYMYFLI